MTTSNFYMDQPKEILVLTDPKYKHYMNGKEMVRKFVQGAKYLNVNNGANLDLEEARREAESLFVYTEMYYLQDGKIFKVEKQ
jgi:hypothetical protein